MPVTLDPVTHRTHRDARSRVVRSGCRPHSTPRRPRSGRRCTSLALSRPRPRADRRVRSDVEEMKLAVEMIRTRAVGAAGGALPREGHNYTFDKLLRPACSYGFFIVNLYVLTFVRLYCIYGRINIFQSCKFRIASDFTLRVESNFFRVRTRRAGWRTRRRSAPRRDACGLVWPCRVCACGAGLMGGGAAGERVEVVWNCVSAVGDRAGSGGVGRPVGGRTQRGRLLGTYML
jgi:hypothetical protein